MSRRFVRLAETGRRPVRFFVDGEVVQGCEGDTLLVAMLTNGSSLRDVEFGGGRRAGFCLMSACQDCWVWAEDGTRMRACDTAVVEGMKIVTKQGGAQWAIVG